MVWGIRAHLSAQEWLLAHAPSHLGMSGNLAAALLCISLPKCFGSWGFPTPLVQPARSIVENNLLAALAWR